MGTIEDFFFSGIPAEIALIAVLLVSIAATWYYGYNRE
jgi:hypothetical protein